MLRRNAVSLLLGACAPIRARPTATLDRLVGFPGSIALLLDVKTRKPIAMTSGPALARSLASPGSTLKPLVLAALLRSGKLDPGSSFRCPARLRIGNRTLNCSHPPVVTPIGIDTALAYSCNCFVAHAAERFAPGELARELEAAGLAARTGLIDGEEAAGRIRPALIADAQRLQALGEDGVTITVAELALAYRALALRIALPEMRPILDGLKGAVEFGTAQNARVAGVEVAGKTGTLLSSTRESLAWFVGFMPAAVPEVVVAVRLPGRSGGADAAPVGGRILEAYHMGKLASHDVAHALVRAAPALVPSRFSPRQQVSR